MPVGNVARIDAYLATFPAATRKALERLRAQIRAAAPNAEEGFGYGLPGFYLDGALFYYGAAKAHCGLYGAVPPGFERALKDFRHSKGTVRFTPEKPLPAALVKRLVKARTAANKARSKRPARTASRPSARRAAKRKR